jgi:hypothetical protein
MPCGAHATAPCTSPPPQLAPLLAAAHRLRLDVFALRGEERAAGGLFALLAEQVSERGDAE